MSAHLGFLMCLLLLGALGLSAADDVLAADACETGEASFVQIRSLKLNMTEQEKQSSGAAHQASSNDPVSTLDRARKKLLDSAVTRCGGRVSFRLLSDNKRLISGDVEVRLVDIKNYEVNTISGSKEKTTIFKTVVSTSPAALKDRSVEKNGIAFDPRTRSEVNFYEGQDRRGNKKWEVFDFPETEDYDAFTACQFWFAFPSKSDDDTSFPKALKLLGWLPAEVGGVSYMYFFRGTDNTPFISATGNLSPTTEVAFPLPIKYQDVFKAYKIEKTGRGQSDRDFLITEEMLPLP